MPSKAAAIVGACACACPTARPPNRCGELFQMDGMATGGVAVVYLEHGGALVKQQVRLEDFGDAAKDILALEPEHGAQRWEHAPKRLRPGRWRGMDHGLPQLQAFLKERARLLTMASQPPSAAQRFNSQGSTAAHAPAPRARYLIRVARILHGRDDKLVERFAQDAQRLCVSCA